MYDLYLDPEATWSGKHQAKRKKPKTDFRHDRPLELLNSGNSPADVEAWPGLK